MASGQYCLMAAATGVGDLQVGRQQFLPAREGAVRPHGARHAGGVDDEVGVLDDVVVLAGHELDVAADDGRALGDVEALALGHVRPLDVHQRHRARELALEQLLRQHAADVAAADERDLLQHAMSPPLLGARSGRRYHRMNDRQRPVMITAHAPGGAGFSHFSRQVRRSRADACLRAPRCRRADATTSYRPPMRVPIEASTSSAPARRIAVRTQLAVLPDSAMPWSTMSGFRLDARRPPPPRPRSRGSSVRPFRGAARRPAGLRRRTGTGRGPRPTRTFRRACASSRSAAASSDARASPTASAAIDLGRSGGFGRRGPAAGGRGGPHGDQIDPDDHQRGA